MSENTTVNWWVYILVTLGVVGVGTVSLSNVYDSGALGILLVLMLILLILAIVAKLLVVVKQTQVVAIARYGTDEIVAVLTTGFRRMPARCYEFGRYSTEAQVLEQTVETHASRGGIPLTVKYKLTYMFNPSRLRRDSWSWVMPLANNGFVVQAAGGALNNIVKRTLQGKEVDSLFGPGMLADLEAELARLGSAELAQFGIQIFKLSIIDMPIPPRLQELMAARVAQTEQAQLRQREEQLEAHIASIRARTQDNWRRTEDARQLDWERNRLRMLEFISQHGYERLRDMGIVEALNEHGFPPSYMPVNDWMHWFQMQPGRPQSRHGGESQVSA